MPSERHAIFDYTPRHGSAGVDRLLASYEAASSPTCAGYDRLTLDLRKSWLADTLVA